MTPARADPIEVTVAAVARELPPMPGQRADLLAEVRSGLEDAAASYAEAGLSISEASAHAVREFGDPSVVGRELAGVVVSRATRLTAAQLGPGFLIMLTAWAVLGYFRPHVAVPALHQIAVSSFGVVALLTVVVAAAALVARPGWLPTSTRTARPTRTARLVGWTGVGSVVLTWTASYLIQPWTFTASVPFRPVDALEIFSALVTTLILVSSTSCLVIARRARRSRSRQAV